MAAPPEWAQDLMLNALLYKGFDDIPELVWRHTKREVSSGVYSPRTKQIRIMAGSDRKDAKLVLLHEIAHFITPRKGSIFHTGIFWDITWDLYRWAKLPIRYCLKREGHYKKGATLAYHRIHKP
mgnify:CR=1 FL=1